MLREALIDLDPVVWAEVLPKRGLSKVGRPGKKQREGISNSAGTRITAVALLRVHSPRSGVTVTEQIRTRAVSTVSFSSA